MIEWYEGITQQDFTDAVNMAAIKALTDKINARDPEVEYEDLVRAHLCFWKESGIPAPDNELQSIQSWLRFAGSHTKEELLSTLRQRMILLMQAANALHAEGPEAEDKVIH